jgi:hypothetical protein
VSMPAQAETETKRIPEGVTEIPQAPEFPEYIEKNGVKTVQHQITAHVTDDQGQPMMQSPATHTVTIQIPANDDQLTNWSKGDTSDSLTWYGMFWLRIKAKALTLGKKISIGTGSKPDTVG